MDIRFLPSGEFLLLLLSAAVFLSIFVAIFIMPFTPYWSVQSLNGGAEPPDARLTASRGSALPFKAVGATPSIEEPTPSGSTGPSSSEKEVH